MLQHYCAWRFIIVGKEMDFTPSIPGYVFEYVPTPLASHICNFIVKKLPFDETTSSNEKTEVSFTEK